MPATDEQLFVAWRRTGNEDGTAMRVRRIRRRCKQLVQELALPAATDLPGLSEVVARRVGRPVHLAPMSLGGVVSGMTAGTDDGWWVFYERQTSPWHQTHIVLHELSHLLLGHEQDPTVTENALKFWTPTMDVATAARRMGLTARFARHHCYDDATERETEVLGTLLMAHLVPTTAKDDPPLSGDAAEIAAALGPALKHIRRELDGAGGSGPEAPGVGSEDGGPSRV
ncbi:hypothetical protein [Streptomyces niger]|uniref:hypothetical protein n=1 Tax=Streptomyces niger TaxID=66373 RepID=UPI00069B0A69|nr:hypothetical protein [Streptomyces niger]